MPHSLVLRPHQHKDPYSRVWYFMGYCMMYYCMVYYSMVSYNINIRTPKSGSEAQDKEASRMPNGSFQKLGVPFW